MNQELPILITGATGGLGKKAALKLAERGDGILVGARSSESAKELVNQINTRTKGWAKPFIADLSDLDSVRGAVAAISDTPLAGILANAGMSTTNALTSKQGYEMIFAVNVLAHQLILRSLAPNIVDAGRIVIVSSGVHDPDNKLARRAGIPIPKWIGTRKLALVDIQDSGSEFRDGRLRYSTSKLGNILQARGIQRWLREQGQNVDVFACDPGLMVDTQLGRDMPAVQRTIFKTIGRLATPFVDNMRLSATSAKHLTSLMLDPVWSGKGFAYLDGDEIQTPSPDAQRDDLVEELWEESGPLIGMA